MATRKQRWRKGWSWYRRCEASRGPAVATRPSPSPGLCETRGILPSNVMHVPSAHVGPRQMLRRTLLSGGWASGFVSDVYSQVALRAVVHRFSKLIIWWSLKAAVIGTCHLRDVTTHQLWWINCLHVARLIRDYASRLRQGKRTNTFQSFSNRGLSFELFKVYWSTFATCCDRNQLSTSIHQCMCHTRGLASGGRIHHALCRRLQVTQVLTSAVSPKVNNLPSREVWEQYSSLKSSWQREPRLTIDGRQ